MTRDEPTRPLLALLEHGQSYWLDNLSREKLRSGELERRVREEGLRGVTSNPAIFHAAITRGEEYAEEIERLVRSGCSVSEMYERLVVSDIQEACDVLRPVYDGSSGRDGFVSLEVSPYLAQDPTATLQEARRLFAAVDRPNLLIKIPGTEACVPAIEEALFEGINVNITLLFSIQSYEAVAEAYLRALERRIGAGRSVDRLASVASFFLSRMDVLVDGLLGHRLTGSKEAKADAGVASLLGQAAVANAKLAYASFQRILASDRWRRLEAAGGRVQRMLWASTSTKNPLYDDVRYVEPLIGPHTVNTLPDSTIEAFADHGQVADTVEDGMREAGAILARLAEVGIDIDYVTRRLLDEGVQKFIDPFDQLLEALAEQRAVLLGGCLANDSIVPGELSSSYARALAALRQEQAGRRLFAGDPSLWTEEPETAARIGERLGWLDAPLSFRDRADELAAFAEEIRAEGTRHVVLLGMGGSSLSAEVARRAFGGADGWPELVVLDDTDPDAVRAVRESVELSRTLFLVASKSGTTAETSSLYRSFFRAAREALGEAAGSRFVAITDPGTPLAGEAREQGFRRTFENPADIGGRYSALSYFGLVPMALAGIRIDRLLEYASTMLGSCEPEVPPARNPGLRLGALLGLAARHGRDKVTFLSSGRTAAFGAWAEQLLAESTGKEGTGLIPVPADPLFPPAARSEDAGPTREDPGHDRLFAHVRLAGDETPEVDAFLDRVAAAGHPTVRIELDDIHELGAEFLRWEIATAVAGSILRVNPFDEPNVAESKANTRELLKAWEKQGALPEPAPLARDARLWIARAEAGVSMPATEPNGWAEEPGRVLEAFLSDPGGGEYVALLPYFRETPEREEQLAALRRTVAERLRLPVTLGHGPRYLHSSGQLHKGGPNTGRFLILTADSAGEEEIPGAEYGFSVLQRAQALGDFGALAAHGRRVLYVHLQGEPSAGLAHLRAVLGAVASRTAQVR